MQIAQQETWIRERAYAIWEQEGRPAGREHQHWYQAACEMGDSAPISLPGKKAAARSGTAAKSRPAKARKTDA